jgi:hypothetical protein
VRLRHGRIELKASFKRAVCAKYLDFFYYACCLTAAIVTWKFITLLKVKIETYWHWTGLEFNVISYYS